MVKSFSTDTKERHGRLYWLVILIMVFIAFIGSIVLLHTGGFIK